jgi:hypothetical protein
MPRQLYRGLWLLAFWALPRLLIAQADQGGFLAPISPNEYPAEQAIYLPPSGFVLFDRPNGTGIGRISHQLPSTIQVPPGQSPWLYASVSLRHATPQLLDYSCLFHTHDDCRYLLFGERDGGFVRLACPPYDGWISLETAQELGFRPVGWLEYYGTEGQSLVPFPDQTTPLLASPYADAPLVASLAGERFDIRVVAFEGGTCTEGPFCAVEVVEYRENPCNTLLTEEQNLVRRMKGWIRIIDDSGHRLLMHHAGGC